jgi:hypothetical protein
VYRAEEVPSINVGTQCWVRIVDLLRNVGAAEGGRIATRSC